MVCSMVPERQAVAASPGIINLIHGVNDINVPLSGFTVEEVQFSLRDVLNVDVTARAYVWGRLAPATYQLRPGDRVEFLKVWGRKAADRQTLVLVELGPETLARLDRLAIAAGEIANCLKSPPSEHPALTTEKGFSAADGKASPYLTGEEAASYLGVSLKSLYGIVERRHLIPFRGPRRAYRFTAEMLDAYLRR